MVVVKNSGYPYLAIINGFDEAKGTCTITHAEYDERDEVSKNVLYELPEILKNIEHQTKEVHLGCVTCQVNNIEYVQTITRGAILYMHLMYVEDGKEEVLLTDSESINTGSLQAMLINEKIAQYKEVPEVDKRFDSVVKFLKEISDQRFSSP